MDKCIVCKENKNLPIVNLPNYEVRVHIPCFLSLLFLNNKNNDLFFYEIDEKHRENIEINVHEKTYIFERSELIAFIYELLTYYLPKGLTRKSTHIINSRFFPLLMKKTGIINNDQINKLNYKSTKPKIDYKKKNIKTNNKKINIDKKSYKNKKIIKKNLRQKNDYKKMKPEDKVVGQHKAKSLMLRLIHRFDQNQNIDFDLIQNALFYGPTGTGKTLLGKAVASETELPFLHISGPSLLNKYVGETEKRIREKFKLAKKHAPSIIFFDELDALASKRSDKNPSWRNNFVTQLLTCLDGLDSDEQIIFIATTNRPNDLDPAIRRPGRLDLEIPVPPPDIDGRKEILKIHTKDMPLSSNVNLNSLAEVIHGYVGADIVALCKEAALNSVRRHALNSDGISSNIEGDLKVTMKDFKKAKTKIVPSSGRDVITNKPNTKWHNVGGMHKAKKIIEKKIINTWNNRSFLQNNNFSIFKGILLYGPPGTGKTYISKALANKLNLNIISLKGSDILSKYHGESTSIIRSYFEKANLLSPSMILIDEIDAIAPTRNNTNKHSSQIVNELLSNLDGFDQLTDILVVGTTNRIDIIDSALLRSGRFDIKIPISKPKPSEAKEILKIHLDNAPLKTNISSELFNEIINSSLTGADIESLVRNSVLEALWNDKKTITQQEISKALNDFKIDK